MGLNRHSVGAFAATAALLAGGGAALAASGDAGGRSARCEARLARIAEQRGTTVAQLTADVKTRVLARIAAAEKAGRITSERATKLRQRVAQASLCRARLAARHHVTARLVAHRLLRAAAEYLGLDREELRTQLPGTSLAALAEKQGKNVSALEAAMVAPAEARLAKAVANGRITKARADTVLERLERAAGRLAQHVFPRK
jgi:hypothetical protein